MIAYSPVWSEALAQTNRVNTTIDQRNSSNAKMPLAQLPDPWQKMTLGRATSEVSACVFCVCLCVCVCVTETERDIVFWY